jgi:hypothetical protein
VASLAVYVWWYRHLLWLASSTFMPVREAAWVPGWLDATGPHPDVTKDSAAQLHAADAADLALSVTALFVLYLSAVWIARGRPSGLVTTVVFGFGVLFQLLAVLAPFALSGDAFSYAFYGRMFSVYGGSPYLEFPAQYPGDPFFDYVFWKYVPSFYGPLWTLICGGLVLLTGDRVGLAVLLFRLTAAVSAVAATIVVCRSVRQSDPDRAATAAALVAWSPFVVVESGLSAHNDALMALLIVVSLACAWRRQTMRAVGVLMLAGLVKLSALALLPLLGIYLLRVAPSWRARFGVVVRSALAAVPLTAAIVWPVWAGDATFAVGTLGSGADRYVNSLAEPALGELRVWYGEPRDNLEVPLQFSGWWVGTDDDTELYADRAATQQLASIPAWSELLVVGPEREQKLRVFDPTSRYVGFVDTATLGPIDTPADLMRDPETAARMRGPLGSWQLEQANNLIRAVGWGTFALAFVLCVVFGTGTARRLTIAWVALCLILCALTLTWFWPWYLLWGLLPAALVPRSRIARLMVLVSWGVLLVYVGLGFADTRFWFLFSYRSLAMFGLPILVFVADEILRGVLWCGRLAFRLVTRRRGAIAPPTGVRSSAGVKAAS